MPDSFPLGAGQWSTNGTGTLTALVVAVPVPPGLVAFTVQVSFEPSSAA